MNLTPIVFVVDDDISVRESLELLIRRAGWQCRTFASAREFLVRRPAANQYQSIMDALLRSGASCGHRRRPEMIARENDLSRLVAGAAPIGVDGQHPGWR